MNKELCCFSHKYEYLVTKLNENIYNDNLVYYEVKN